MVSDLLHHLDTEICYTDGAGGSTHQSILNHLSAVSWLGRSQLTEVKCDAHLQKGPAEGSTELQACQPNLGAREGQ